MIVVCIEQYSLAEGEVGKHLYGPEEFRVHRSLAAAGRTLGSLISGKHRRYMRQAGRGTKLYAFDTETGLRYSRRGCQTGVPL